MANTIITSKGYAINRFHSEALAADSYKATEKFYNELLNLNGIVKTEVVNSEKTYMLLINNELKRAVLKHSCVYNSKTTKNGKDFKFQKCQKFKTTHLSSTVYSVLLFSSHQDIPSPISSFYHELHSIRQHMDI